MLQWQCEKMEESTVSNGSVTLTKAKIVQKPKQQDKKLESPSKTYIGRYSHSLLVIFVTRQNGDKNLGRIKWLTYLRTTSAEVQRRL